MTRSDLDHLPARKRRELELALRILFEEFDAIVRAGSGDHKRNGRILAVMLFGSHARGDWVEDRISGYRSDYDLLVVVNHDKLTDPELWHRADERLLQELLITKRLKTTVNVIVHSSSDVNDQLAKGRYFFADIVREGVPLYQASDHRFIDPMHLSEDTAHEEARRYFDRWFLRARQFYQQFQHARADGALEVAAFDLHQTVESLYNCLLLVRTLYSPPTHNLKFLRSQAEQLDPRLIAAWPRDTKPSRGRFELLKRAYVEARYSPHYKIDKEELDWLAACIERLRDLVGQSCRERLSSLQRTR